MKNIGSTVRRKFCVQESKKMFERAQKFLAGGASSSARTLEAGYEPGPIFVAEGKGSRLYDVDGNVYIDYLLSFGALILGHANEKVAHLVKEQLDRGSMYGSCFEVEYLLAEKVVDFVPCADLVRFANSGSEAVSATIRLARAYTGKNRVIKFEGHYHGWLDVLYASCRPPLEVAGLEINPRTVPHSPGIPQTVLDDIIIVPWNNLGVLERKIKDHKDELAAIIAEPVVANSGCIMPEEGYLQVLRELTEKHDIVLIFDEIVTGFRLALGGAQEYFGVVPDLAAYSKALGGGYPISAFAGKKELMNFVADGRVKHSGTYNGNPLGVVGAYSTLTELQRGNGEIYKHLFKIGEDLMLGMKRISSELGFGTVIQGLGPMFQIFFTSKAKIPNYREAASVNTELFEKMRFALLKRGVNINPGNHAAWFISAAHDEKDVKETLTAFEESLKEIQS